MGKNNSQLPDYDIAVIGGGASGIYSAWRMLLEGPSHSPQLKAWKEARGSLKIGVFEGSDRIGGRVLSAKAPHLPDIVCEIGGMRYVSTQTLVKSLVENKFDLHRHEQAVSEEDNIAYLRGKNLRVKNLQNPDLLPYDLSRNEIDWLDQRDSNGKRINTASNFIGYAIEKIFPDIASKQGPGLRAWLNKQILDGVPLWKHGFWNVIAPVLSHEAYEIAITTVGYDCLGYNTNAVDAICEYFDFTPDVKYYLLDKGYEYLFWTMQQEFQKDGGDVILETWLQGFDDISLPDGSRGVTMQFKGTGEITARAIVLAMPQRSLSLLEQRGPILDPKRAPHVQFLMNSVEPIHLYKMFIAYKEPWWENRGVSEGRSLTDIPIRQCYYWGEEGKKDNSSAILMVYNDAVSSDFWGGLRNNPLGPGDTVTQASEEGNDDSSEPDETQNQNSNDPWSDRLHENWRACVAPERMMHEMNRQLTIMHDLNKPPEPIEAAFKDWGDDPYGGAVHFWNPGYKSADVLHQIIQPVDDIPCYICGEAYSTNQTWVEGAFQTAELVLRKFGIPEPAWLHDSE